MRVISCCALTVLLVAGVARAQSASDLQIKLGAYSLMDDGGEKPLGIWYIMTPVTVGKAEQATFSWSDTCEGWAVSSDGSLRSDATTAWKVEVTPLRIVKDAVTFRLRWSRAANLKQQLDRGWPDAGRTHDDELTLRPGESLPVDSVRIPAGARTVHGRPCGSAASIRVVVDNHPGEEFERRLVAADLWLVERLANGTEAARSKPLSIRGLPNHPFPFYFDSVVDANASPKTDAKASLMIVGTIVARLNQGAIGLAVETRSLWDDSGMWRSAKSQVDVKPDETVEIRLPKLSDNAGPFAKRDFSIKVRTRQLR